MISAFFFFDLRIDLGKEKREQPFCEENEEEEDQPSFHAQ